MKIIDAGHGGGQVLRTALSLAALTRQNVRIENIRQSRPKPGLQPQHRTCVDALARVTAGGAAFNEIGSSCVEFKPGAVQGGKYEFDIKTAGSCSLLLQCLLPPLLFAKESSLIRIRGGTDVPFSPPSLFLQHVFCPALKNMGAHVDITVEKHGFYPKGGGVIEAAIQPVKKLFPIDWKERGNLRNKKATILYAQLPPHVAEREKTSIQQAGISEVDVQNVKAANAGNTIFIQADYAHAAMGFDALGKVGKPAEQVAKDALEKLHSFEETQDACEPHLLDQLMLYAALASGKSRFATSNLSEHTKSNLKVLHEMLGSNHRLAGNMLYVSGQTNSPDSSKNNLSETIEKMGS